MIIQQYAPVVIPTLKRYVHLQRCLGSLDKGTGADKTDVYVELDYPSSELFVDGWKRPTSICWIRRNMMVSVSYLSVVVTTIEE